MEANIVPACRSCNSKKGDRLLSEMDAKEETVQIIIKIPGQTHRRFKAACAMAGLTIREALVSLMEESLKAPSS